MHPILGRRHILRSLHLRGDYYALAVNEVDINGGYRAIFDLRVYHPTTGLCLPDLRRSFAFALHLCLLLCLFL